MKICMLADVHNDYMYLDLPKADVLIFAGDIDALDSFGHQVRDFNKWIGEQKSKFDLVLAIGGNHDKYLEGPLFNASYDLGNAIYLKNSEYEFQGVKFWGSPYTPAFNNWFFMKQRGEELKQNWSLVPADTNVLIGHGMPYGILDQIAFANGDLGDRVGDSDLLNRIKELKNLKLYIGGHLHLNGGKVEEKFGVKFVNCSVMDEEYNVVNDLVVVEI